jgi:DNA-binding SARP family transcriptional activator
VEFQILGPLQVVGDEGRPVELGGPKARALLAALLIHANEVVSTDRLFESLWGAAPPESAANTTQTYISHLRDALEPARPHRDPGRFLLRREPGYLLVIAPDYVDAGRFERLAVEGRGALASGYADEAVARLREALGLWRGEPLADFTYEPFAQGQITRLSELRLGAHEDLLEAELALGAHAEVAGELAQLVVEHPLRERLWGQFMLALYRSGRQADALATFTRLRDTLVEQLGLEPSPALVRLQESILLQKPELDVDRPPTVDAKPASVRLPRKPGEPGGRASTWVDAGRTALARGSWPEAFELLSAADGAETLAAGDLEGLADAAYWSGHFHQSVDARQRAYASFLEAGDRCGAARTCLALVYQNAGKMKMSVAGGWFARASGLLEEEAECLEHGYLAWTLAVILIGEGDRDGALDQSGKAIANARRFGDRSLEALALAYQGSVLARAGRVGEGTAMLDEAMASAVAGELAPVAAALVFCQTISLCNDLGEYRRAGEWIEAVNQYTRETGLADFPGDCRAHRAAILGARGAWSESELEARRACAEMENFDLHHAGLALREIGEIRLQVGDLDGAEEAFRRADELEVSPQPGYALVQLARGDAAKAMASIRQALAEESWDKVKRARLLPAQVEIAIAASDEDSAKAAAAELAEIAADYESTALTATAECARGSLLLARGECEEAAATLRRGGRLWKEVGAPYKAARARLLLAKALMAGGDAHGAALETESARLSFERLGAIADMQLAARLATDAESAPTVA